MAGSFPHSIGCVVPTLNSAVTLDATLLSLCSQQRVNLEIVVADSGSTDGTLDICRRWEVPTIYVPPGNMYRAINAALKQFDTKWLAYLNSDDLIFPDSYARLIDCAEQTDAAIVYGNCDYLDEQGRFIYSFGAAEPDAVLPLFRLRQMGFAQPATVFRRDTYHQLNGFDESLLYRADADFFIRALLAERHFAKLPGPSVASFRLHSKQFSNRGIQQTELEAERIFGRRELKPQPGDKLKLATWRLSNLPHYIVRIVRESLLSNRTRLPRSIETYTHQ